MIVTQKEAPLKKTTRSKRWLRRLAVFAVLVGLAYAFAVAYAAHKAETALRTTLEQAGVEAAFELDQDGPFRWVIRGGRFRYNDQLFHLDEAALALNLRSLATQPVKLSIGRMALELDGKKGTIEIPNTRLLAGALGRSGTVILQVPEIRHIGIETLYFHPFQVTAEIHYDTGNKTIHADYVLADAQENWQAAGTVDANWHHRTWGGDVRLAPLQFSTGGIQPVVLSPLLAGLPPLDARLDVATLAFTKDGSDAEPEALAYALLNELAIQQEEWRLSMERGEISLQPLSLASHPGSASLHAIRLELAETMEIETITVESSTEAPGTLQLKMDGITHVTGQKPYFRPLRASADISYDLPEQMAKATYVLGDRNGQWSMEGAGSYEWQAGTWQTNANLLPVQFETGILQPDELFPILRGKVQQVRGGISGEVKIGSESTGSGTIHVDKFSASVEDTPVRGVSGTVRFSSLNPLSTNGQQMLEIGEIVLGLPLSEGKLPFSLIKNTTLKMGATRWRWAGGTLKTEPMTINLTSMNVDQMRLDAEAILLESLLANLLEQGLSATGTLSGSIPVRFENGKPVIENGLLKTEGGGVVKYAPQEGSALQKGSSAQTDILLNAMQNFEYEYLTLKVDSIDGDTLNVQLSTKGKNPDLYGGKPIELNVNLTGNLWDIARSGSETIAIPKRIEEQLTQ